jgi:hypothetical protein
MMTSAFRPIIVYAHNSHNNSISAASITHSYHPNRVVLNKYSAISKTMRVLDKEKVDAVCLNPAVHKELAFFESRSPETINTISVNRLSFQSPILRI